MSFFKKDSSKSTLISTSSDSKEGHGDGSELDLASQFQTVGMFLSWVPPPNAVLPRFQKWKTRSSEQDFESSVADSSSTTPTDVMDKFNAWIRASSCGVPLSKLTERRKAQFQHRPEFKIESTPTIEKQKAHIIRNRVKLLHIDESFRPTFFGTFTTIDPQVHGRKFLGKAAGVDYEIDSEDESFDLGEDLGEEVDLEEESKGSDEEDEEEELETNEYEFDGAFLVPDGHLSDGEAEGSASEDESEEGETKADKALLLAQTKRKLNAKTSKLTQLTPKLTGVVLNVESLRSSDAQLCEALMMHAFKSLSSGPFPISVSAPPASSSTSKDGKQHADSVGRLKRTIPTELLASVAQHVHKEHQKSFDKLLDSLRIAFPQSSKKQLGLFIREKCEKVKTAADKVGVWLVKASLRAELGLGDLNLTHTQPPPHGPVSVPSASTYSSNSSTMHTYTADSSLNQGQTPELATGAKNGSSGSSVLSFLSGNPKKTSDAPSS
jgi:hypothetical protein